MIFSVTGYSQDEYLEVLSQYVQQRKTTVKSNNEREIFEKYRRKTKLLKRKKQYWKIKLKPHS